MTKHERKLSALIVRAGRVVQDLHIEAIRADLFDPLESGEAWQRFQRALHRMMILAYLNGGADGAKAAIGAGWQQRPDRTENREAINRVRFARAEVAVTADLDDPQLMSVAFTEAVEALAGDVPGLAEQLQKGAGASRGMAAKIAEAEARGAIVRGVSVEPASAQVRRFLAGVAGGAEITQGLFAKHISHIEGISRARTDVVYRTNLMDAFNAGRFRQYQDSGVFVLFELNEIRDKRTRGNPNGLYPDAGPHFQMDGYMAAADDPIWRVIWPPNGWNCRADIVGVTRSRAKRLRLLLDDGTINRAALRRRNGARQRLIDSQQYPDDGFRGGGMISAL